MKMLKTLGIAAVFAGATGCASSMGGKHDVATIPNADDNTVTLQMGARSSMVVDFTRKENRVIMDGQVISTTPFSQQDQTARNYREFAEGKLIDAKMEQINARRQASTLTARK